MAYVGLKYSFDFIYDFSLFGHVFYIHFGFKWVLVLAFLLAFASASQDVVIDAYRVDYLSQHERPIGASITTFSYRLALLFSLSVLTLLVGSIGWNGAYYVAAFMMLLCFMHSLFLLRPIPVVSAPATMRDAIFKPLNEFLARSESVKVIVFILLYRISDNMATNMNMLFLKSYLHFSNFNIGAFSQPSTIAGIIVGTLIAGLFIPKLGLYRALLIFGCLQALSNVGYVIMAVIGKSIPLMVSCFFLEHLFSGMATIAFVAFLMGLCDSRFSATQYALFSAMMSLPKVILGPIAGEFQAHFGWVNFYLLSIALGFPSVLLLLNMKNKHFVSSMTV